MADYSDSLSFELDLADTGIDDGITWVDGAILADDEIEAEAALETLTARVSL